jgi:ribonuclease P protein component
MQFTLNKQEKLKSKKLIEQLFIEGKSVSAYPLKLIYLKTNHDGQYPIKAGVSVSKRKFKNAVNRNKIKRLLREAYRTNKHIIYEHCSDKYIFMFLYVDENEQNYVFIEEKMTALVQKFLKKEKKQG